MRVRTAPSAPGDLPNVAGELIVGVIPVDLGALLEADRRLQLPVRWEDPPRHLPRAEMAGAPSAPAAARCLLGCWEQLVARANTHEPVVLGRWSGAGACAFPGVRSEDALHLRARRGGTTLR
eukprot:6149595-Alexandrium_andersonii.AAC.1